MSLCLSVLMFAGLWAQVAQGGSGAPARWEDVDTWTGTFDIIEEQTAAGSTTGHRLNKAGGKTWSKGEVTLTRVEDAEGQLLWTGLAFGEIGTDAVFDMDLVLAKFRSVVKGKGQRPRAVTLTVDPAAGTYRLTMSRAAFPVTIQRYTNGTLDVTERTMSGSPESAVTGRLPMTAPPPNGGQPPPIVAAAKNVVGQDRPAAASADTPPPRPLTGKDVTPIDISVPMAYQKVDTKRVSTWALRPTSSPIKARLTVRAAPRGEKTELDASASTAGPNRKIKKYTWTLTPTNGDLGSARTFETTTPKVPVVLLDGIAIRLVVSDGERSAAVTKAADPLPRDWKLDLQHLPVTQALGEGQSMTIGSGRPSGSDPRTTPSMRNWGEVGRNVCYLEAFTGDQSSGHIIHSQPTGKFQDHAYKVQAVDDERSPHHGCHYLSELVPQKRQGLLNMYLFKGSELSRRNFSSSNPRHGQDFRTLVESVEQHEALHTQLLREALTKFDPGAELEEMASCNAEEVPTRADTLLKETESALQDLHNELEIAVKRRLKLVRRFNRSGEILVQDDRPPGNSDRSAATYSPVSIPNFADISPD